jgi:hypothetical protein
MNGVSYPRHEPWIIISGEIDGSIIQRSNARIDTLKSMAIKKQNVFGGGYTSIRPCNRDSGLE